MGKIKNNSKKSKNHDDYDDDDSLTTSYNDSSDIIQEIEVQQEDGEILEKFVDDLYEKRSSTRVAGLKGLVSAFSTDIMLEFVESRYETLSRQCLCCLRRELSSEICLAAKALGLLALTVGSGNIAQHLLDEGYSHLVRVAKLGLVQDSRISAVECLAILTFVAAQDVAATERSMEIFMDISKHEGNMDADQSLGISKPSPALKAAAMSGWSLLLSTLPSHVINYHVHGALAVLSSLLDTVDTPLRKVCGEAVALICEISKPYAKEVITSNSFDDGESLDSDSYFPASNKLAFDNMEEHLIEQIRFLSIDSGRQGRSRKERSLQRGLFREVLSSIEGSVCPEISLKLRYGDVMRVNTWSQSVQFNALKHFLAEGFQKHMQENPLLHEVFGYEPRVEKRRSLTVKEKRMYRSPNSKDSKAHTQMRSQRRACVQARNQAVFNMNDCECY